MRNLKKALALVLALMMTLSLMVTASAADYADGGKIEKNEAVDVMSAINVFQGTDGGNFDPSGSLTRAQAAKIIAYMKLGPTVAETLPKDEAPFGDVKADRWYTGYVTYAKAEGIINGRSEEVFDPNGTVTGYEFGKMVLEAAGISGEYSGTGNWKLNINIALQSADLLDGVNAVLSVPITREQACQLAFNGLNYTAKGETTGKWEIKTKSGETKQKLDGEVCETRTEALMLINALDNANSSKYEIKAQTDNSGSLAADVFKLTSADGTDAFGAPARVWSIDGKAAVTVAKGATLSYDKKVKAADIAKALNVNAASVDATVVTDGKTAGTVKLDTVADQGGPGATVDVYQTGTATVKIVVVNTYVGTIKSGSYKAEDKTKDQAEQVTITLDSVKPDTVTLTEVDFETSKFTKDDEGKTVLYTAKVTDATHVEIVNAEFPAEATGTVTRVTGTTSFIMGGTTYTYSLKKAGTVAPSAVGKETTVYLDKAGNVIAVKTPDDPKPNLAVMTALGKEQAAWNAQEKFMVTLLLPDQTQVDKEISKIDGSAVTNDHVDSKTTYIGKIYTYVENDGKVELKAIGANTVVAQGYNLKEIPMGTESGSDPDKTVTGNNGITRNNPNLVAGAVADKNTVFMISNADGSKLSFYTGISAVPSTVVATQTDNEHGTTFVAGAANFQVAVDKDGVAKLVYVAKAMPKEGTSTSSDVIFILGSATAATDTELGAHQEYPAVVNGEITTLNAISSLDSQATGLYKSATENEKGLVKSVAAMAEADGGLNDSALVGVEVQGSNVKAGANSYVYGDNTKVYVADGGAITEIKVDEIETDDNDNVWGYKDKDGVVAALFIEKVAPCDHSGARTQTPAGDASQVACNAKATQAYWTCNACGAKFQAETGTDVATDEWIANGAQGTKHTATEGASIAYVNKYAGTSWQHAVKCANGDHAADDASWTDCTAVGGGDDTCSTCHHDTTAAHD